MAQRVGGGVKRVKVSPAALDLPLVFRLDGVRVHRRCSFSRNCSSNRKPRLRIVAQRWKLNDIDTNAVQERFSKWVSKSQKYLSEVATPLIKKRQSLKVDLEDQDDFEDLEELLTVEQTVQSDTPRGSLSFDAIISIEQFSRMNGLTGKKMQDIFETLVPPATSTNARYLVEYCCFRFLSRDSSDFHPCLKEPAFQRLIFITMLAWANPYCKERNYARNDVSKKPSFQISTDEWLSVLKGRFVEEEAFVRIAPAISGVADRATVHNLFEALAGASDQKGISLEVWLAYIQELVKIHEGRKSYQTTEFPQLSSERLLCMASNRKGPVLKWENNVAWPGKLTLTDKALYFQPIDLKRSKGIIRLDLVGDKSSVQKAKVGPLGFSLFDSAVTVSSGSGDPTWVLEFVDLGGDLRRDVWHSIISEVIALHTFLREFGPEENDRSLSQVFGARKGKEKAIASASNCIARLQALQYMRNLPEDPIKLAQFSFLRQVAYGDIVCQTLAVNFWGGPLVTKVANTVYNRGNMARASGESYESFDNASDLDGSVYLKKWMRSPSWGSNASINFWKSSSLRQGLILSKNLAVADLTLVERAAETCRQKYKVVEKTQATINAATIKGIPSNIDLFKELILPLTITATKFEKLRRWEEPYMTVSFLAFASTIIFRNLLQYVLPVSLVFLATGMLTLKGLRRQGRLGRLFGMVTIRDQPSSNTIQKIIAVKDAMQDLESCLQNVNVVLLKLRTIVLSGHPQVTTEVALVLLSVATVLVIVPFKYVLACVLFDQFTRELEFRKEMVMKFKALLRERWEMVPAAPVLVLPFVNEESTPPPTQGKQPPQKTSTDR
ncbi:uncharacterized protein LOC106354134 isoform X2 [Brassica napus]|uniref:uncharacterized protein LOC106354134 isoform X2 n=1 Tax=Brassica napus TaxID=3708 RepID=UPI002078D231|nr:uncharacterized protein LOC106354134 isoform X2 [Brassica napus]